MNTVRSSFRWNPLPWYFKVAHIVGATVMLTGIVHLLAFPFLDGAAFSGPTGFRKPIVFGLSAGFTLNSMTWILGFFKKRPRLHASMVLSMSAALLIEIIIIDLQRFRGVPSHFNMGTPFDASLWSIMGLSILVFATVASIETILAFGRTNASPTMATALRASMLIFFSSQISGQLIVFHGTSQVMIDGAFISENVAHTTTYGEAGNLKLPHAISLHSIQAIPLLGILVSSLGIGTAAGRRWIVLSSVGFAGIVAIAQIQAYLGQAITDLSPLMTIALLLSLCAFLLPFGYATAKHIEKRICKTLHGFSEKSPV